VAKILKASDVTIRHIKAARALLGWSQEDLADRSGVSLPTIKNREAVGDGPIGGYPETAERIMATFTKAGVEFSNGGSPGVRLTRKGK
jgi:transcriptional regulator with XRE-family HTH domain